MAHNYMCARNWPLRTPLARDRFAVRVVLLAALVFLAAATVWAEEGESPRAKLPSGEKGNKHAAKQSQEDLGSSFNDEGPASSDRRAKPEPLDELDQSDASRLLTRRTEAAIERGLRRLRESQSPDGRWQGDQSNWVAFNSFAMIAFMLNGHFPNKKQPYGDCLTRSLDALLKEAQKPGYNGYIGTNMYAHGLATVALSEAWGQTEQDDKVRAALKAAVKIILQAQSPVGGWRYDPQPATADVSVTAMQVVALAAARQAGIFVPDATIDRAVRYVTMCHQPASGGFTYQAIGGVPGFARTAAATFSMMMLGRHDAPEVQGGIRYLEEEGRHGAFEKTSHYMYGHYYAALVMYQAGDEHFRRWYPQIRDILLSMQKKDGSWGHGNGFDMGVPLIILSIPYGYVPAYQR